MAIQVERPGPERICPEGFVIFFEDVSEVPKPPPGPPQEKLVDVKSATITFHCASALSESVGAMLSEEDLMKTKGAPILGGVLPSILEEFDLDGQVYFETGRNFIRLLFSPLDVAVSLESGLRLAAKTYFMITCYDTQVVVLSLVLPIGTSSELCASVESSRAPTTEDIRQLVRTYYEDLEGFEFNGEKRRLYSFLKDLLGKFTSANGGLGNVDGWTTKRVTVSLWETDPDYRDNAVGFVRNHGYECYAMVGPEEDWRKATPETVREVIPCGASTSEHDCEIPRYFVSLIFCGPPVFPEAFQKWGLEQYTILDIHRTAADAAFKAFRRIVGAEFSRMTQRKERENRAAIERLRDLYFRYRFLRNRLYDTDDYWRDLEFIQYSKYSRDRLSINTERRRVEGLGESVDALRALSDQLSQAMSIRRQLTVSRVLGFFGTAVGATVAIELVRTAAEAFGFSVAQRLVWELLGVTLVCAVAYIAYSITRD